MKPDLKDIQGYLYFGVWPWQLAKIVKMQMEGRINYSTGRYLLKRIRESNRKDQVAVLKIVV